MAPRFIVMDGKAFDPEAVIAVTQNPDGHSFVGLTSGQTIKICNTDPDEIIRRVDKAIDEAGR